jgi:hypothetical protein
MQRMERNSLIRSDSAANDSSSAASQRQSSQNSSRDWGWFEDVHQSTDGLTPNEKKDIQKRKAAQQGTEPSQENPGKNSIGVFILQDCLASHPCCLRFYSEFRHGCHGTTLCTGRVSQ